MDKEQLKIRYEIILTAIRSFEEAIKLFKQYDIQMHMQHSNSIEQEYRAHRDSVIKRFEYSLDTLWKYLKFYLETIIGIIHNSPKPIFRECQRNNILSEQETLLSMDMVNARNETFHMYREEIAEQLITKIPEYYDLMKTILARVNPHIKE